MRIGTWNLENLFRPGTPGGPTGPDAEAVYSRKLDALAARITEMAPDVLAVQEVGTPESLQDLTERIGGTWHRATADPDDRGIRVGFLSRVELTGVTQVAAFPKGLRPIQVDDEGPRLQRMGRPALLVHIPQGAGVDLISCHLKSKLLTYPDGRFSPHDENERARYGAFAQYRRAAEAVTVRSAATALLTGGADNPDGLGRDRAVLVLGDLNDEPEAATTQILLGPPGSQIGTAGYLRPDAGDGQRLWNLFARIPEANRFSRIYRGERELIDHVLASKAVTALVKDGDIDFHGPAPASIDDTPDDPPPDPGSDHRALLLQVDIRQF